MKNCLQNFKKTLTTWGVFSLILFVPVGSFAQCVDVGDTPDAPQECDDGYNCNCSGPFNYQDHDAPLLWVPGDVTLEWYDDSYYYLENYGNSIYARCNSNGYTEAYYGYDNFSYFCELPYPEYQLDDCCTPDYWLENNLTVSDCYTPGNCVNQVVGTVIRTFTVMDQCGNTSTKTQKFTLKDTTAPYFVNGGTSFDDIDCSDNIWDVPTPSAYDNCDDYPVVSLYQTQTSKGACAYDLTIIRTWRATDNCGNSSFHYQYIYVSDGQAPVFSINSLNMYVECDDIPAAPTGVTAYDACLGPVSVEYEETINPGFCENEYQIQRVWSAVDSCYNHSHVTHTINVTDNTDPELAPVWDLYQECDDPLPANNMTATDNCDDDVEIYGGVWQLYSNDPCERVWYRHWEAYDNCGNEDHQYQYLTQFDLTPPVIWAEPEVTIPKGGEIPEHGLAVVWDNCTDTADIIVVESDDVEQILNCLQSIITRTYTAIDQCGNSSQFVQTIYFTADDFEAPVARCHNITVGLDANGEVHLEPSDVDGYAVYDKDDNFLFYNLSSDNCSIANMTVSPHHFYCDDIGQHQVTLSVIDAAGNTDYCYSYVYVIDDSDPIVVCENITLELEDGIAFLDFPDAYSSTLDNCSVVKFNTTLSQYNFTAVGTYQVLVTVYDPSGNSGTCITTVTVVDDIIGAPAGCNPEYFETIPTGCYSSVFEDNVTLYWDAYSNGTACQLFGNKVSAPDDISIIVGIFNDPDCPDSKVIPLTNLEPTTVYRWKVRCGCQSNPSLIASPFTDYAYFQTPGQTPGVNGNGEEGFGTLKDLSSEKTGLSIYPNPNNGQFTLSVELDNYNVEVFDLAGKLVWGQYGVQDPLLAVELSDLDAGLYQVTVFNEEMILTEKIIIQE